MWKNANRFGFDWLPQDGGCHVQVTRTATVNRGKKGTYRALEVRTPKKQINVYVSPTGLIRVFDGKGNELKVNNGI